MPTAAPDYFEAVTHLPAGACLRMDGVSWDDYEELLHELGEGYAVKVFFDNGRMEITAPAYNHEQPISLLHRLVTVISDELDIDVQPIGSTTLRKVKEQGAEPDDGFYVQNAPLIIGKQELDLTKDPPPDIVVEVDRTSSSLDKFSIYASLNIPELWRLYKNEVKFFVLVKGKFQESETSRTFPFLTSKALTEFLTLGLAEGERKAAKGFREWISGNK